MRTPIGHGCDKLYVETLSKTAKAEIKIYCDTPGPKMNLSETKVMYNDMIEVQGITINNTSLELVRQS